VNDDDDGVDDGDVGVDMDVGRCCCRFDGVAKPFEETTRSSRQSKLERTALILRNDTCYTRETLSDDTEWYIVRWERAGTGITSCSCA
jgi:hypothetical protein